MILHQISNTIWLTFTALLVIFLVPAHALGNALSVNSVLSTKFGYDYDGIFDHPKSVSFTFEGQSTDLKITLSTYDIDFARENQVFVNGESIGFLDKTSNNEQGSSVIMIPLESQLPGENTLEFIQRGSNWKWGISDVLLTVVDSSFPVLQLNNTTLLKYGYNFDGVFNNPQSVSFSFDSSSEDLILTLSTFDIDFPDENQVFVNGEAVGYLDRTENNNIGRSELFIPQQLQRTENNTLEFVQRGVGWKWGITDILLAPAIDSTQSLIPNETITNKFGYNFDGVFDHPQSVSFTFEAQPSDLALSLSTFDIDFANENEVFVNGVSIGFLDTTGNNSLGFTEFSIPLHLQQSDTNTIEFFQRGAKWKWGITDLALNTVDVSTPTQPAPNINNYKLIFEDEFSNQNLDPTKWDTGLLWGPYFPINNEKQLYVDTLGMHSNFSHSPFEFTGSTLKITATPTSSNLQPPARPAEGSSVWQPRSYSEYRYNGPSADGPGYQPSDVDYLSGILTTYESLKMTYGYVEMRAKLPAGQGLWPAFWLLNTHYVEDVPEIDVMEFLGHDVDTLYHTYHYFDIQDNWRKISTPSFTVQNADWTQDFHTYGMAWSPTEIIYYIDGVETRRITDDEFLITGQAMYLIANLAVGGNWPGDPDASTPFPASFEIDYIRAYERKLQPTLNLSADYQLMFEDNFTGSTLDASKWNTSFLWGPYLNINNEEQYYVDALGSDNATAANTPFVLNNGVLSITAREANDPDSFPIPQSLPDPNESIWSDYPTYNQSANYSPGNYTSGIITSYDSFKFVSGYAEMRAKIPKGQGLWPAFWLLNGYYVGQQPEIDILEVLGHAPQQSYHTYHRLDSGVQQSDQGTTDIGNPSVGYADGFHTYGVRWRRGKIDWYIDGNVVHTYEGSDVPYQLMYVIANLAVGGNWPGSPDSSTEFPATLDIDYIRVYQERHKED